MLQLGCGNLAGVHNVEWVLGSGADLDVLDDRSVDDVFSYITLQHVPTTAAVLGYLEEAGRVLRPGGLGALQVRHPGPLPWALDLAGHLVHAAQGRRVWSREWRGTRIPARRLFQAASRSGPASSYDRVAVGTCGCCCGADSSTKANANRHHSTPTLVLIAQAGPDLPTSVWMSTCVRAPALTSGPSAPAS